MPTAASGDTVRIHYTGTLSTGEVFDTSDGREPLEFTLGGGQVIPGFDAGVTGMAPGETKTVTIPAEEAYGPRHPEMMMEVPREQLPPEAEPSVGDAMMVGTSDGQQFPVVIVEVTDDGVMLDANHPLAGEDLTFELTLVEIQGKPAGSGLVGLDGKPLGGAPPKLIL